MKKPNRTLESKRRNPLFLLSCVSGVLALTGSGCATATRGGSTPAALVVEAGKSSDSNASIPALPEVTNPTEITVQGVKLKNTQFDIPVRMNSQVEQWVDYFTGRGRPYFELYLKRSEYFIPYITPILKKEGLPTDLVYLAMIESGFHNYARSWAKAAGPWQFMSATGKRYGLQVNWWVDERLDIEKSTLAAGRYLRDLYGMFGSWEMAAAAYNAGETKVARAAKRFGSLDFWVISKHRFLKPETRHYVPKMIAAAIVAKNRTLFGFQESYLNSPLTSPNAEKLAQEEVKVTPKSVGITQDENLVDSTVVTTASAGSAPEDEEETEESDEADVVDEADVAPGALMVEIERQEAEILKPFTSKQGEVGGTNIVEFEVNSPADLLKVSEAAGVPYQTVKSLNPAVLRWCTPPTVAKYRIRLPASAKQRFISTYNHPAYPRDVKFRVHKIARGETLSGIARRYGMRPDGLRDLNRLSSKAEYARGRELLLPIPNDITRSLATLDIKDPPRKSRGHRSRARASKGSKRSAYRVSLEERRNAAQGKVQ